MTTNRSVFGNGFKIWFLKKCLQKWCSTLIWFDFICHGGQDSTIKRISYFHCGPVPDHDSVNMSFDTHCSIFKTNSIWNVKIDYYVFRCGKPNGLGWYICTAHSCLWKIELDFTFSCYPNTILFVLDLLVFQSKGLGLDGYRKAYICLMKPRSKIYNSL